MDPVRNPFSPDAGRPPPELAGRDALLEDASVALQRTAQGRAGRSHILYGLRGTGKTVLLNTIRKEAHAHDYLTTFIEAPEGKGLLTLLYPEIREVLRQFSLYENAKAHAHAAARALASMVKAWKVSVGDVTLSVEPETGVADSGSLERDLSALFLRVGQAAQAAGRAWALFIDEVQYLSKEDLGALIVAVHRANQEDLPIIFFGVGLPQVAGIMGNTKSYAERLFLFVQVDHLDKAAAFDAIRLPVEKEGESITDAGLEAIFAHTQGYPYFLQEWGFHAWKVAQASPIDVPDIDAATQAAIHRLDESFFRVRLDRLTLTEKAYVQAMAGLPEGPPYRSKDVAAALGKTVNQISSARDGIIKKGMAYSPAHGDIAFTVPMFAAYLTRATGQDTGEPRLL